jgi:hypothetical protein
MRLFCSFDFAFCGNVRPARSILNALSAGILTFGFLRHPGPHSPKISAIEPDGNPTGNVGTGPQEISNGLSGMYLRHSRVCALAVALGQVVSMGTGPQHP